ncbi:amino acid adenylation domain-containing protein [Microdochium trichocladiopsis]|uniref:Amino acid adenylation domain-containing protein n=1 Tax=Microdochium trichocladiopsis TaxID=1682393 RepID=A0A9P8Y2D4_9PEZI|nr:amino acid adenylation domain-containing protein [Microdochium trichocladiopsis]KAH7027947.1 amino acid adenylation domain-containing protein [Microdochium trichocladiopsis]
MAETKQPEGLSILNPFPASIAGPDLLHDLVESKTGTAIEFFSRSGKSCTLSYVELHAAAEVLARRIVNSLQGREDSDQPQPKSFIVPLLIPQSPALYVAQLAILKAGGAFCPLNLDAPQERIKFILNDVDARVALCSSELAERIPGGNDKVKVLILDNLLPTTTPSTGSDPSRKPGPITFSQPSPESLAYVMYTSGSTGTPKGVGISHRAATQALLAHDRHIPSFKRFLQFAAPTFDVSVFEIFFPLMRGSTLVCCDRGEMLADLPGTITGADIDACELTPSVAGSLLRTRDAAPCLRLLLTIGEMLTEPVVKEFGGDTIEDSMLWGMYGPTEATIHCTLQPAFLKKKSRKNIGFPLDNVSAFIIDADPSRPFEVLPFGQAGELVVGGTQLAVGYVQRPEQTASVFIDSPYGRVYRTGDKAIMAGDGTIECLGRLNDTQVKLNGQRMELGEVEQVVLGTPGCHSAVAAIISNTLVAFAAVEDTASAEQEIADRCKAWLPAFMVPAEIRVTNDFPRLPSGKVDRKKLVADYEARERESEATEEQYADDVERKICRVAEDILGRQIRPASRIASAGIDSLVAIEYASGLRRSGIDVSVIDILESATIHHLNNTLKHRLQRQVKPTNHDRQGSAETDLSRTPPLLYGESLGSEDTNRVASVAPCTLLQQSMISETLQDPRLYVNELRIGFPAGTSPESIQEWFCTICDYNRILQSGFVHGKKDLCNVIWDTVHKGQIQIVDEFNQVDLNDIEKFLRRPLEVQILGDPSSASEGPLAKVTIHHAIYDGWTSDLLLQQLNHLYRGDPLPSVSQFHNIVQDCEGLKLEGSMDAKEYWAEQLRASTLNGLPNFRTRPVKQPQISTKRTNLSASLQKVRDAGARLSLSHQVVFQAALAWLWSSIVGADDVIIGSVFSGRTLPVAGIESAMGPFMATLPLRVQIGHFGSVAELLQVIQASNRNSLRHGGLPLSEIKKAAGIPPRSKIFDVIFAYQESLLSRKTESSEVREINHKDAVEAKLLVEVQPVGDGFMCQMTWHDDVFNRELIECFIQQFESIVNHFLDFPDSPLNSVQGCFPAAALSTFNPNPKVLDVLPSLARLVENTVEHHPDNIAIQFAESIDGDQIRLKSLSYAELNSQANQIARHLQSCGVKPGDVVAIVMEKSSLLYCSILAILKTGSAYLPMLPSTPMLRKQRIIEQAVPRVCLTSKGLRSELTAGHIKNVVEVDPGRLSHYPTSNLDIQYDRNDLAYVIYTSGTTGVPKGVAVTNRNMLSNIKALSAMYPHEPSSRMLQACSQAFDVSVFEIFFAWANGMCLCSATNDTLFGNLSHAVNLLRVSHLSMTVTVASLLHPDDVPTVEFLVTSGEAMTDEVLAKWSRQLWQGYGPSETTNICTVRKVQKGDSSQFLGWAFMNTSTFVCHPGTSELVPIGCVGEFCFGGDQVAAGYLQMPELTAEKFFDHPKFGRLYRSGDRGRMLPDGSLIILGRIDTQIKLRGLRIELQEIQRVVLQTGLAKTCEVVVVKQPGKNIEQLALFYAPSDEGAAEFRILPLQAGLVEARRTIQQEMEAALPDYMIPTFSIPISTLPRTSSGKVDRQHLRTTVESLSEADAASYSAQAELQRTPSEWTEVERLVAQAAADTANVDVKTITQWSSFATLGIDSILAMTLARNIQAVSQRRVPLSLILKNASVGRLAAVLGTPITQGRDDQTQGHGLSPARDLLPLGLVEAVKQKIGSRWGDIECILPCTPLQEGMLFSHADSSSGSSYCNIMLFKLQVSAQEMLSHWKRAIGRHGILRTCFASTDSISNAVVQLVLSSSELPCKHFESVSLQQTIKEIEQLLSPPVDSGKPPVFLASIQTENNVTYLCFACHHALYDGISMKTLLAEIETLAMGGSLPAPVPFERFLADALAPVPGADEFWKEQFDGFVPSLLEPETSGNESAPTTIFAHDVFHLVMAGCIEHPYSHIITRTDLPKELQTRCGALHFQSPAHWTNQTTNVENETSQWSPAERIVRSAVARLVNLPESRIAREKPLFHYGVDSIGIVQIVGMLKNSSLQVSVADVMESPTCAKIAAQAVNTTSQSVHDTQPEFDFDTFREEVKDQIEKAEEMEDILPCTPIQQAMLSQSATSDERLYFNYVSWELDVGVDAQRVVDAWKELRKAHQILRTGFVPVNNAKASYAMVVHPASAVSGSQEEQQIQLHTDLDIDTWRKISAGVVFNALSSPPWCVAIVTRQLEPTTMNLAMHHALYDAHSLQKILNSLAKALRKDVDIPQQKIRPALSRIMATSEDNSGFWKNKASEVVVNKFPTMTPLVEPRGISAISKTSQLGLSDVKGKAADLGVSVQAALQVAWTRLLSAYLGEPNVTFGVVFAGRSSDVDLGAVFPMITTLPVVGSVTDTVPSQLQSMMQYNAGLLRHYRTPLSAIQNWLGRPAEALFDTILVYQVSATEEERQPWNVLDERASVEYTVSLEIEESARGLRFNLVFDTSVLPSAQAEVLLSQFDALLGDTLRAAKQSSALTSSPSLSTEVLSILPAAKPTMPCDDELLHRMMESSSRRNPEAVALEFVEELKNAERTRQWTYAELDSAGNRVANFLSSKNVPQGSIVAVCFNKVPEAYFSILGILKAGCCFLALDTTAPATRQEFILKDSNAACLIVEDMIFAGLGFESPVPVYAMSSETISHSSGATSPLARAVSPSDPCYCLYTSGTTGTPKGCLISHENTVQAMLAFTELFSGHWTEKSRWLQFASFHFDVSVLEQYWSWHVGITVVSAPRDLILSNLIDTISQLKITHIDLTPSLARLVHPDDVPSLCEGVFITGGEQLRQDVLEAWGPQQVIYNAYGPTEATIGVTMFQRVPANGRPANIGRQFPNVGSFVLKPGTDEPVLRGAVGELCVSGKLVGIGYLNRPELTAERFAYLERFDERVYRTGDLVRVLHDGSFDFLGRADDQVKLRGQRLEIGEINHAIKSGLPYPADVATLVAKHGGQQDRDLLVSFITISADRDTKDELKVHRDTHAFEMSVMAQNACKGQLSGYMVPSYVLCVPWIPLSANNKADIKRLKTLFQELSLEDLRQIASGTKSAQRALNSTETRVASIVSDITGVDLSDITHSSTILELGIDSISVTRLSRALQSAGFDRAAPPVLLKNGQIEHIAGLQSGGTQSAPKTGSSETEQLFQACYLQNLGITCETLGVEEDNIEYIVPCTPLQEGMIARARSRAGGSRPYFNQFEVKVRPDVSKARLRAAWTQLQEASAILRTAFLQTSEGVVQVALKHQALRWAEVTSTYKSLDELIAKRHAEWVRANEPTIAHPFEIDYITFDDQSVLVIRIFHALYDAHSLKLMFERVAASVEGNLIDTGATFHDALQAGPLSSGPTSQPFWTGLFQGWQAKPLAIAPESVCQEAAVISRRLKIDGFEGRRKGLGVTHQTMVQTAWLVALQHYLQAQPCFGIVYSGRSIDLAGADNVIGPLFNTLPFTTQIGSDTTWDGLARQVQEFNATVLEFVHTPLRSIQKWCSNGRPLFDSLFTFDREDIIKSKGDDLWEISAGSAAPDYNLALEALLTRDGHVGITIVAQPQTADHAAVTHMLDSLESNLQALVTSDKDTPVLTRMSIFDGLQEDGASRGSRTTGDPSPRSVSPSTSSVSTWPEQDHRLRHEIALIAGVNDEEVLPGMTIFDFGLDSIDAIRLASKAASFGYRISPGDLLRGMAIDGILLTESTSLNSTSTEDPSSTALEIIIAKLKRNLEQTGHDLTDVEAVLPTTPLQDSMVAEMVHSDFKRYFNQEVFRIPAHVDIHRLKSAWEDVYDKSPILRTTFAEVDSPDVVSAYCQVVKRTPLPVQEIRMASVKDLGTALDHIREEVTNQGGATGLFRLTICHTGNDTHVIVSVSHALYDGQSLSMIYNDVTASYRGSHVDRPDYKPHLARLVSTKPEAADRFWSNFLHDLQPTALPALHDEDAVVRQVYRQELPSRCDAAALRTACRKLAITPQVLAQASWAVVLSGMAQCLESTFGLVLSGRDTDMAQQMNFPTMNTVAMRVVLRGSVKGFLRQLQTTMSHIMEHQHTPLRQIQKLAQRNGQPLFNTLFVFQVAAESSSEPPPLMEPVQGSSAVEYPICVEFELTEPHPVWRVACDSHYASEESASRIIRELDQVMQFFCQESSEQDLLRTQAGSEEVLVCGLKGFIPRHTSVKSTSVSSQAARQSSERRGEEESSAKRLNSDLLAVIREISGAEAGSVQGNDHVTSYLDSISAIKACALLRKRGISLTVRQMLSAGTIASISAIANSSGIGSKHSEPVLDTLSSVEFANFLRSLNYEGLLEHASISSGAVEKVLPALPVQVHMLSGWQNTNGALFWPTFKYKLKGAVSRERLANAWERLVAETVMLRTEFLATGSSISPFLQVVLKPNGANGEAHTFPNGPLACQAFSSRYVCFSATAQAEGDVFDISLRIHHALYDAFSMPTIMGRFKSLCRDESSVSSFSDYKLWSSFAKMHISPMVSEKKKAFWTSYLQGMGRPTGILANKASSTADQTQFDAVSEYRKSAMTVSARLVSIMATRGVMMQDLLFAAHAKSLAKTRGISGDGDIVIGIYLSNRSNFPGLDAMPCPTLALLPLRVRSPGSRPVLELAKEIRRDIGDISGVESISAGLWEIQEWTGAVVDTFVNFLPAIEDSRKPDHKSGVSLELVPQLEDSIASQKRSSAKEAYPGMMEIAGNHIRSSYPDALDVEAAVRDGCLDIGLFSQPGKLSRDQAVHYIDEIVKVLGEVELE